MFLNKPICSVLHCLKFKACLQYLKCSMESEYILGILRKIKVAPLHFGASEIPTIFESGEGEQGTEEGVGTMRESSAYVVHAFLPSPLGALGAFIQTVGADICLVMSHGQGAQLNKEKHNSYSCLLVMILPNTSDNISVPQFSWAQMDLCVVLVPQS